MQTKTVTLEKVTLFGVPVSKLNMEQTVHYLSEAVRAKRPHQVVTMNPIILMTGFENPDYMRMLQQADLGVPDGGGFFGAASRVGKPVAERVAGFDLVQELCKVGAGEGWSVYLLGATQEVIEAARDQLVARYPGLRVAGIRNGYFGPEEDEAVVTEIAAAKPDLLLVGRSVYTQDPWIANYRDRLNVPVMIGVGGSFDVMSGRLKRAPRILQSLKLEWLYRLMQEPARWRRMLVLPKFALQVMLYGEKLRKH